MANLYKFYPDKNNPNYESIKEEIINWLTEKGGMKESKCRDMQFKNLYDIFVSKQKKEICAKPINEYFDNIKYFINKFLDKKQFDKFRKKFDDYHRFFPEKVLKVAIAYAYLTYNKDENAQIKESVENGWKEDDQHLDAHLSKLLNSYAEQGGNCEFIKCYAYVQANGIMQRYGMRSIVEDYKVVPRKYDFDSLWEKDLKRVKDAYNLYSTTSFLTSLSTYENILSKFDALEDKLELFSYVNSYIDENDPNFSELGFENKKDMLSKISSKFFVSETELVNAIGDEDIPLLIDNITDHAKYKSLYYGLGNFRAYRNLTFDQMMTLSKQNYILATDYVVSSLGGKTKELEKSSEVLQIIKFEI